MNEIKKLMAQLMAATTDAERQQIQTKLDSAIAAEETRQTQVQATQEKTTAALEKVTQVLESQQAQPAPAADPSQPATPPAQPAPAADQETQALLGRVAKLEQDNKDKDALLEKQQQEKTRTETIGRVVDGLKKSFGDLAGQAMAENLVDRGVISLNQAGVEQYVDSGITYTGAEVLEQLRTLHKENLVGESGPGTRGGTKKVEPATAESIGDLNAHQLLRLHFEETGIIEH